MNPCGANTGDGHSSSATGTGRTAALLIFCLLMLAGVARGQGATATSGGAQLDENQLAREVNDPTAILTQLKLQDLYTPRNFQTSAQTNSLQAKVVLPIEPFAFMPLRQIVRTSFEMPTVATSQSSSTTTAFGDVALFDLFISNWPDPDTTGFGWAVGPTFVFPTGRVSDVGKHAWQAGPAAAAKYLGIPDLTIGFLFQDPISFAYSRSSAIPQSQMTFQPLVSYALGRGWYVKSADSTWTINWHHGTSTTIPLSLGFGKVTKFAGPYVDTWVSGEWMAYRQYTSITPMYTVRFGLTLLFPNVTM